MDLLSPEPENVHAHSPQPGSELGAVCSGGGVAIMRQGMLGRDGQATRTPSLSHQARTVMEQSCQAAK